ncbi:expressed unknown protein [Seminavis robusta]|uniref:G-protein coupled receptors family 2 profile 2 domain-containing protein n=1 Tax=Seminavis robusta TaxID=568900 RepID=A0A9N8DQB0_9STRA|nr:expressed unknown protein [Seminavis robusta]|eukprot:Sro263_g102350.1 n/a (462) ;mRNA; r:66901-68286
MAMVPRCTAALSLPSSLFIIYEVFNDHRRGKGTPIQRALVGMSIFDCLSSFGYLMSSWFVPKGFIWGSAGNMTTCNLQGFLVLSACGPPMFNSCIAVYCTLIIVYRWTDAKIARFEKYIYPLIFVWAFGINFVMMFFHIYQPVGSICWPAEVWGCYGGIDVETGEPCSDPHNKPKAWVYAVVVFYVPIYLSFLIILFCLIMIFVEVRRTHLRLLRYAFGQASSNTNISSSVRSSVRASVSNLRGSVGGNRSSATNHVQGRSRNDLARIANKAILYSVIFVITFLPSTVWSVYGYTGVSPFGVVVAALFCEPLQGFFNLLTFARDRPATRQKLISFLTCGLGCSCLGNGRADRSTTSHRDGQNVDDSGQEAKRDTGTSSMEASNQDMLFDEVVRNNTESNARQSENVVDEEANQTENDEDANKPEESYQAQGEEDHNPGIVSAAVDDDTGRRTSSDLEFAEG